MKVVKDADRVGKKVTVSENMEVLYSATFSGAPLDGRLLVEYLRGDGPDVLVQTTLMSLTFQKEETTTWDLAAIASGDFNGDKLKGLKEYAAEVFPDVEKPVIAFRTLIIHESESIFHPKPRSSRAAAEVVHSRVKII